MSLIVAIMLLNSPLTKLAYKPFLIAITGYSKPTTKPANIGIATKTTKLYSKPTTLYTSIS